MVFDAQFINDCAQTQFTYILMRKRKRTSTISRCRQSPNFCINFRRPETDFAVIHNSPSIRAGSSTALFQKLEDCESSNKVLSWWAAIKRVTWQLSSKFLCSPSVHATQRSSNTILGPIETRKLSFRLFAMAITELQYLSTLADRQWQVCFSFLWSMG